MTVCIPWDKKHPEWLEQAVKSVHPNIPIIVRYGNGTAGNGLNKCLESVQTEYMFILAADDILHPDCLVALAEAIGTADFAYPTLARFGDTGGTFDATIFSIHRLQYKNFIPGCFMGKTSAFQDIRWDEDAPLEDWDFHYRASQKGYKYVPVRHAIYFYRVHGSSLSNRIDEAAKEADFSYYDLQRSVVGEPYDTICSFVCDLSPGTSYVRAQIPAKYLPGICVDSIRDNPTPEQLDLEFPNRAVIFQYPTLHTLPLINRVRKTGRGVYADCDDDYTNPELTTYLKASVKYDPGYARIANLWKSQRRYHRNIVSSLDGIIVSTPELAERYSRINGNVFLALNTVDPNDWPEAIKFDDGITRVGYACGSQHGPDTEIIYESFKELSRRDDVEIIMIGLDPNWDFEYRHVGYTRSMQVYRDILSILDIGVAPLQDTSFNHCKSDLKWLEYTMAYCATVAQNQRAYNKTMVNGKHGTLVGKRGNWLKAITELIDDKERREEYVKNSLDYVSEHRLPKHMRDVYIYVAGHASARVEKYESSQ